MHFFSFFFPWGLILQAIALVHFIRRRPTGYWLWAILFLGPIGALVYIVVEMIPDLGLLQTLPTIIYARSFFGRAMQFSATYFSPIFARGLATLQGYEGPFWGHNALVRVRAFFIIIGTKMLVTVPVSAPVKPSPATPAISKSSSAARNVRPIALGSRPKRRVQ